MQLLKENRKNSQLFRIQTNKAKILHFVFVSRFLLSQTLLLKFFFPTTFFLPFILAAFRFSSLCATANTLTALAPGPRARTLTCPLWNLTYCFDYHCVIINPFSFDGHRFWHFWGLFSNCSLRDYYMPGPAVMWMCLGVYPQGRQKRKSIVM